MKKLKIDRERKVLSAAIVACLVLLLSTATVAAEPVDLFFLVDGTDSIDAANFTLQKEGYAYAINDSTIVPQNGDVSVCIIMFGYWKPGTATPEKENDYPSKVEVNLTTITNQTVADSVSAQIMAMAQPGDQTAIDSAFILANDTLNLFGDRPGNQTIDIATDGRPNINESWYYDILLATAAAYNAKNASVEEGYFDVVNALGVDITPGEDVDFMKNLAYPQPWDTFPNPGFYIEAVNYTDFKDKIKAKIKIEITNPDIRIDKSVNTPECSPGDVLKYTIDYSNTGDVNLTGVVLNDMIPANTTYAGNLTGPSCTYHASNRTIICDIGTLTQGSSDVVSFDVWVNASVANGTWINNTATINSTEVGPESAEATTMVLLGPPILGIRKDVDKDIATPDDVLTYTIRYNNTGDSDATNTVINDTIPDNTTYVDGSATGGGVYYASNRTIIWNNGTLPPGGSGVVSFEVTINSSVANGTWITNTATINSTEDGPVSDDASTWVKFKKYDLCPKKDVDKPVAAPNETLSYRIYYKNVGTGTLTNVMIRDKIPDDTTYITESMGLNGVSLTDAAGDDAGTYYPGNNTLSWYIGTLNPGVEGNATFKVRINASVPGGTIINNTAVLTSDQVRPPDPWVVTRIVPRPPVAVPVLTPVGIVALIGLLSLVAIGSISVSIRRRRQR